MSEGPRPFGSQEWPPANQPYPPQVPNGAASTYAPSAHAQPGAAHAQPSYPSAYPSPGGGYAQPGYPPPPGQTPAGHPAMAYPPAPPPEKKRHIGRLLGAIAIVIVGLAVIASVANKGGNPGTGNAATKPGLNQPVRDGKFEFVVTSVTCGKDHEGTDPLSQVAQGQYCEVRLTVKNIGTEPQYFAGSNQKAKGVDGATFGNDSGAELYANADTDTLFNKINPGNTATGILVFDIPRTARIASLELHDSALSGGATVTVG